MCHVVWQSRNGDVTFSLHLRDSTGPAVKSGKGYLLLPGSGMRIRDTYMGVGTIDWGPGKESRKVFQWGRPHMKIRAKETIMQLRTFKWLWKKKITRPGGGCAGGGNWVLGTQQEARVMRKRQSPSTKTIPGAQPSCSSFPLAPNYFSVGRVPKGFESGPLPTSIINWRKQRKWDLCLLNCLLWNTVL